MTDHKPLPPGDDGPIGEECPADQLLEVYQQRDLVNLPTAGEPSKDCAAEDARLEQLNDLLPDFETLEFIGRGGMGAVYKARQRKLDRLVAIKILPNEGAQRPGFAERFEREAQALARLNHHNIVTVHDFGERDGLYYIVMEYVDGASLADLIAAGKMRPDEALAIVPQICDALEYAHAAQVVHRDIKPSNILLDRNGRVKITDFGIAKLLQSESPDQGLTGTAEQLGTPAYMAPEQRDDPLHVDHRADIYSLGVVFYEMLTGEIPSGRFDPPSKRVQVDVKLDEVVLKALDAKPEHRYQHASEIKERVEPVAAKTARRRQRQDKTKAHMWLWPVAAAVALLSAWFVWVRGGGVSPQEQEEAVAENQAPPPPPPHVVVVSQAAESPLRTINDGIKEAIMAPEITTVRVAEGVYHEQLDLFGSTYNDLTLETTEGATLAPPQARGWVVSIGDASNVTLRGFTIAPKNLERKFLIIAGKRSPGVVLEDLTLIGRSGQGSVGVSIEGLTIEDGEPPLTVRNCEFRNLDHGIRISGTNFDQAGNMDGPLLCRGALVADNRFLGCQFGIQIWGRSSDLLIAGNLICGGGPVGLQFLHFFGDETRNITLANNTIYNCGNAFRLWDEGTEGENIVLRNNLTLKAGDIDWQVFTATRPDAAPVFGNGAVQKTEWATSHNWRESEMLPGKDGWIEPGEDDEVHSTISGLNRDADSPEFLRPQKASGLATEGAGTDHEGFPDYVGAIPPAEVKRHVWQLDLDSP